MQNSDGLGPTGFFTRDFFFPFYSECYLKALKNDMFLFGQQWFSCIEWIYLVYIVYVEAHAAD